MRRALAALLVPTAVALVAPLWATHTAIGFTAGASGAASLLQPPQSETTTASAASALNRQAPP